MTCVSNIRLRDLVGLVQDNLKSEVIGAVNTLTLSGDVKLDEQVVPVSKCNQ